MSSSSSWHQTSAFNDASAKEALPNSRTYFCHFEVLLVALAGGAALVALFLLLEETAF